MKTLHHCGIAIAAALLLIGAGAAHASGYGHNYGYGNHHGHWGHHSYQPRYRHYGYRSHYGHRSYRHHGHRGGVHLGFYGHGDGTLALGVLAGVLFGYAISNHNHSHYHRVPSHYYRETPRPVVVYRPVRESRPRCVQQREYSTTIVIDGQAVPAWGFACLKPDGVWERSGLHTVP